jgi:DNA-binding NarL/FixJ family response regulator
MRSCTKRSDYVSIVEACYRRVEPNEDWCGALLDVAEPALGFEHGLGFMLTRETDGQVTPELHEVRRLPDSMRDAAAKVPLLDVRAYRTMWYPRNLVVFMSTLSPRLPPPTRKLLTYYPQSLVDVLGIIGHPAPGLAFVLCTPVSSRRILDSRLRDVLHRVRIHVESSLRLRFSPASIAVAVLTPEGRLEHLEPCAHALHREEGLPHHVKAIENARLACVRSNPHDALLGWNALVDGRWSAVEHEDTDGKRSYLVFENTPQDRRYRALSAKEDAVLHQFAKGLTGKHVAYVLGISETAVSDCLAKAAIRLGFRNKVDMIRCASQSLRDDRPRVFIDELTSAEHAVFALLRRGMSDTDIAAARSTSKNTIRNQIASLLRKTSAANRLALATAAPVKSEESEEMAMAALRADA